VAVWTPSLAVSAAERTWAARIGAWLFRHRGVLPIPVLAVAIGVRGDVTTAGWIVGLTTIAAGVAIRLAGVAAAGPATRRRTRTVSDLITHGVFAWTRTPIYIGNGLAWTGLSICTGVRWFVPVAVAAFAVEYGLIVRYEEGVLESSFGSSYLTYKRRTPRWLPCRPSTGPRPVGPRHDWRSAWRSETSTLANCAAAIFVLLVRQRLG
jgi:protein-S-isoprenylcysteine O-methyltransferase Ste14